MLSTSAVQMTMISGTMKNVLLLKSSTTHTLVEYAHTHISVSTHNESTEAGQVVSVYV